MTGGTMQMFEARLSATERLLRAEIEYQAAASRTYILKRLLLFAMGLQTIVVVGTIAFLLYFAS